MATNPKCKNEKIEISEIDDKIIEHFDIKKRLGKGAYGIVWKAIDRKTEQIVAVKKIFDAFRNGTDAQRTFREIMFLRAFRNHPNVIKLHSIYKAENNLDMYLSFEYMESDLHNVIKRGSILKDVHKRYVMYQLLNAIHYIHSGNVIHRDLKPSNVLIDSKCRCKIADFGLARSVSQRQIGDTRTIANPNEQLLTDYVATRWYRAPEILVASKRYTKGIDLWSIGCILGEMIRGTPLFRGSSTVNQIERIISALPDPTQRDIASLGNGFGAVLLSQPIISSDYLKLDDLLSGSTEDAKDLVKSLLVLDAVQRLTAKEALQHKYIEKFRHTIPEAELSSDILPPFRDDVQLSVSDYRTKLYEIIQSSTSSSSISLSSDKDRHQQHDNNATGLRRKTTSSTTRQPDSMCSVAHSRTHDKISNVSKNYERKKTPSLPVNSVRRKYEKKMFQLPQNSSCLTKAVNLMNVTRGILAKFPKSEIGNHNNESKHISAEQKLQCRKMKTRPVDQKPLNSYQNSTPIIAKIPSSLEKRHSIDCAYNATASLRYASPSLELASRNLTLSSANLSYSTKNPKKNSGGSEEDTGYSSFNKYSRNIGMTTATTTLTRNRTPNHPTVVNNLKKNLSNILDVGTTQNGSYYEQKLRNLEAKVERHKNDLKALFSNGCDHIVCVEKELESKWSGLTGIEKNFERLKTNLNTSKFETGPINRRISSNSKYDHIFPDPKILTTKKFRNGCNTTPTKNKIFRDEET